LSTGSISSFIRALKAAFVYHWNLLFLGAALAVAFISKRPDVVLPLAAAVEILYVTLLAANPRYQRVVEAKAHPNLRPAEKSAAPSRGADEILRELGREDRARFDRLQGLCQQLRQITNGLTADDSFASPGLDTLQMDNLNRLLWIYLKMLYSKTCLENFFRTINDKEIKAGLQHTHNRLQTLGSEQTDDPKKSKHRRSLLDMRQTLEARLNNYNDARENYDFLQLELERLYSKISGIVEMGINRQDAAAISAEIDVVSSSVMQTEKTIHDLESITGFTFTDEKPPLLLKSKKSMGISS
jgi:hypothetical protein